MLNVITKLSESRVQELVNYLDEVVQPQLAQDVSNYALGRQRIWFPYEAPLSDKQAFSTAMSNDRLWNFCVNLCNMIGWQPDLGLVSKGGVIKPHRDAAFADFKSIGINLGKVTWCYTRSYPDFAWVPGNQCVNPPETTKMEMTGGEVFEFNCKNLHWTEDVDPNRWGINLWKISNKKRAEYNQFLSTL